MKARLTKRSVSTIKPRQVSYDVRDTDIKGFLLRVRPTDNNTYFLQYRNKDGRQTHFRIGSTANLTPIQARDVAEKRVGEVANGVDIQAERINNRAEGANARFKKLGGFIKNKYAPWVREHRKDSEKTLGRIELHFTFLYDRPMSELNPWIIEKWRSKRLKVGINKVTVNRDISALKAALSKAVEWNIISEHPIAKVKPLKVSKIGKVCYLSEAEEKRLMKTLTSRDRKIIRGRKSFNQWRRERGYEELPSLEGCLYGDHLTPIILVALNTGLRRGEIFNLQWMDVNFSTKTLMVHGETAKSGETHYVPLNKEIITVLKNWKAQSDNDDLVFPGKQGKPLNEIKSAWYPVVAAAKLSNFRFHDLRHSFASKLVMKGIPG